jgi:3-hydroxyisobutyrate dehydrogenase
MGSAFVEALRRRGEDVVVWNRTRGKAEHLTRFGAKVAATPADAVRGARRVHSILVDDPTVDAMLDEIAGALEKDAVVIDHTTVAPAPTAARYARCDARGIAFLHAPIFMSPQAVRDSKGLMMCSGPRARVALVEAELSKMAGEFWYVGERVDKAAALKLIGNQMLVFIVAGLADDFALAKSIGLKPAEAHELFSHFNPAVTIEFRGGKMVRGDFSSAWDLAMARKDVRLMLETAAQGGETLHVLPCIAKRMDDEIAAGKGRDDLSVIAREAVAS